jgi:molybdate transport system ATP-binding protein
MFDIDCSLVVSDGRRRFELAARFCTEARFVALHGPSGSGKSLTLRAVAGLLRPQQGHVRVAGRSLLDTTQGVNLSAAERRLGVLFQSYALFPHLSVRENIAFGLRQWHQRLAAGDAERVDSLIERFGLHALAASRPHTLSGGQAQRVALARALACEPQALVLDEPFAALNPLLRRQMRQELAALVQRERLPVLMVTHDLDDVLALAERALLFDEGRIVDEVDVAADPTRARERLLRLQGGVGT